MTDRLSVRPVRIAAVIAVVGVFAVWLLAASPASASGCNGSCPSGAQLNTLPASNVGTVHATLNGSSSGWGSGDYCAFEYYPTDNAPYGQNVNGAQMTEASPCGVGSSTQSYAISDLKGLVPGESYSYFLVHCGSVQTVGDQTLCKESSSTTPEGWNASDTCWYPHPDSAGPSCPSFTLDVPTGQTEAATSVGGTSATLNAVVYPKDDSLDNVVHYFEYSTDPNLAGATKSPMSPGGGSPVGNGYAVSDQITGLTPGTTYYYRVDVEDAAAGQTVPSLGPILSFTTGPSVRTYPTSGLTGTGATLNGNVSAGAEPVGYIFIYSTSDATDSNGVLSNATTVSGGSVPAFTSENVSTTVSGLSAGTQYYAQLVTGEAAVHGEVVPFTTPLTNCSSGQSYVTNSPIASTGFLVTGCWGNSSGVWTGQGPVEINGVTFSGPPSGQVTVNTNSNTISTSVPYDVDLPSTRVYDGALSGALSRTYATTTSDGATTSSFDVGNADDSQTLYDLPLGGYMRMDASSAGGATVGITALGLPSLFGGVTADGSVTVGEDGSVQAVSAQLGDSAIGPMTLPGFTLTGDPQTGTWQGDVNLSLPLATVAVTAQVEIQNGQLNGLGASFDGVEMPIDESGLVVTGGGFSTTFSPLSLGGSIDADFGPKIGKFSLLGISAAFDAAFDAPETIPAGVLGPGAPADSLGTVPFTLGINGTLQAFGFIQLVSTNFDLYAASPQGTFVTLQSQLSQPLVASCGSDGVGLQPALTLGGWGQGSSSGGAFELYGQGSATLNLCTFSVSLASVEGLISSKGMGFCGSVAGLGPVGVGFLWPSELNSVNDILNNFTLYPGGGGSGDCTLAPYQVFGPFGRGRAASTGSIRLPGGLPFAVIKVVGRAPKVPPGTTAGKAPLLAVKEPNGRTIKMTSLTKVSGARHKYLIIPDAANNTTYIELTKPPAGGYAISAEPGSTPIKGMSAAHGEPAPKVTGQLSKRGSDEVLKFRARRLPAQRLTFFEVGAGGGHRLASTTKSSGSIRWKPEPGLSGARYVVVQIYEHGTLNSTQRLARFVGPKIAVPRRPSHLAARRHATTLTVTWHSAGPNADKYLVLVATSDGRRRLFVTKGLKQVVKNVPKKGAIRLTVTAVNALGQRGAPARLAIK